MTGGELLVVAGTAAVLSWIAVGRVAAAARDRSLLDVPTDRSSHTTPTPRGGGIGIVAAIAATLLAVALLRGDPSLAALAVPVVAACVVGFVDDRRSLAPAPKMLLLLVVAALALPVARLREVELPFVGVLDLGVLSVPLTLFWLSGFANAFNFMDGINGISGFTAVVCGTTLALATSRAGDAPTAALAAACAGAGLGFLPRNFPSARIFMGDSGSLPLGLLLAMAGVRAATPPSPGSEPALPFPAVVLVVGPYVFDVTFTLVRRALRGAPLGQAHKEHLYQRLARIAGSHATATLVVGAVTAAAAGLALVYGRLGDAAKCLSLTVPPALLLASAPWVLRRDPAARSPEPPR